MILLLETAFNNLSESVVVANCIKIMEDYKTNPRISENVTPVKGLLSLIQGSYKIRGILEGDSNCSTLIKNV